MKMLTTTCINYVLWAWLDELLPVDWGHVMGRFARLCRLPKCHVVIEILSPEMKLPKWED
jgi:hypothetical protein